MEKVVKGLWAGNCSELVTKKLVKTVRSFDGKGIIFKKFDAFEGSEAVRIIYDHGKELDLVFLDQNMPRVKIVEDFLKVNFFDFFIIRLMKTGKLTFEGTDKKTSQIMGLLDGSFWNIEEILEKIF
jgi:hypothetical protein